jgi:hypothetical protein
MAAAHIVEFDAQVIVVVALEQRSRPHYALPE